MTAMQTDRFIYSRRTRQSDRQSVCRLHIVMSQLLFVAICRRPTTSVFHYNRAALTQPGYKSIGRRRVGSGRVLVLIPVNPSSNDSQPLERTPGGRASLQCPHDDAKNNRDLAGSPSDSIALGIVVLQSLLISSSNDGETRTSAAER